MSVETASYISDLVSTSPAATDQKSEGDDHIRLLKSVLKTTFPNVTGAVSVAHTKLNYLTDVTSNLQAQIDLKAPAASPTFTGTVTAASISASGTVALAGTSTAVTPASTSNSTAIATTEYVQTAIAGATGGASRAEMYFYGSF